MITSNDVNKVPKLIIDIPESEPIPSIFLDRFNLSRLSPVSKTPKPSKPKAFSDLLPTPSSSSKHHRIPQAFITNSNNLHNKDLDAKLKSHDHIIKEKHQQIYKDHLLKTYQSLKFIKDLRPVDWQQLRDKRVIIPRKKGYEFKKTVIFDLDETLVHCNDDNSSEPTVTIPITLPSGEKMDASISIRPYALECLKKVSKDYEVIVFTASQQFYADAVLDYLDADREIIHHRFYRQHCIFMDGIYIKDLRIFANRKIKEMIIVDNFAHSFAYQLDNGIPIISWIDNEHDKELHGLVYYLKKLEALDDVREANKRIFRLKTFVEDYSREISPTLNSSDFL